MKRTAESQAFPEEKFCSLKEMQMPTCWTCQCYCRQDFDVAARGLLSFSMSTRSFTVVQSRAGGRNVPPEVKDFSHPSVENLLPDDPEGWKKAVHWASRVALRTSAQLHEVGRSCTVEVKTQSMIEQFVLSNTINEDATILIRLKKTYTRMEFHLHLQQGIYVLRGSGFPGSLIGIFLK